LNITSPSYSEELHALIEPYVYEYVAKLRGSISAEHGLGFVKNKYIHHSRTPEAVNLMKQIKTMMDPKGILNPYKTLPNEY
jgi:FAD/FMN-containing dehydrogenase